MSGYATTWDGRAAVGPVAVRWALRPLQIGLTCPSFLYLGAMAIFLFRPPDLHAFYADRVAFGVLVFLVFLRALALRQPPPFVTGISLPMLGLTTLAVTRALHESFDSQNWSILASKFIVPFTLFHVAILVFRGPVERRRFELFALCVLTYLILIAIAFLVHADSVIFPRFILDEGLGFHTDRARGPFLQAVANGIALNMLGILAVVFARGRRILLLLLWAALPVAILATMTRAVWIAFAISCAALGLRLLKQERRLLLLWTLGFLAAGAVLGLNSASFKKEVADRTGERGPVTARMAVYDAGWGMFREHPLTGWDTRSMYGELARRMDGYRLKSYYVHNTYLALLVEFGIPGLALYAILFLNLFRLSRSKTSNEPDSVSLLRRVWPIVLGVYLFNAFFVDMAYQFVIGLLFTVAGILCASEEAAL